ncbi:hypothetical protein A7985_06250 [Pseudoalteromonas luteoviolacea]|uniref:Uncharacterized protein n=1 Tax=Pseudoalteromonas luteoviolacea TaxID=43657 RepID=A0A1C0TW59_9GAMM|nr:hypothetical protein [Pseudoalteromonas luteoviolacea]OCQ23539.1 hypothetical protein A7985_06250 [Pseudoalteromonas luteoviolacea]
MNKSLSDALFRSLGTHALKELSISLHQIQIVVAPWDDLQNEAIALFENVNIIYVESHDTDATSNLNLPWDIIRLDSIEKTGAIWEFGLCCAELTLGFTASMPTITFR